MASGDFFRRPLGRSPVRPRWVSLVGDLRGGTKKESADQVGRFGPLFGYRMSFYIGLVPIQFLFVPRFKDYMSGPVVVGC